jgi:hypothetical protein
MAKKAKPRILTEIKNKQLPDWLDFLQRGWAILPGDVPIESLSFDIGLFS